MPKFSSFSESESYAMEDQAAECGGYCDVSFRGFSACPGNCPVCPNFVPADSLDSYYYSNRLLIMI